MKHAVLILAHNNFSVISCLLEQLDMPEIEIYIHINKKVKYFPKEEWINKLQHAKIHFVKRYKIGYCNYSMVNGVMSLFKEASSTYHDYYHLISGADLLIKKRSEFLKFFEENKGKEFVGFSKSYKEDNVLYRHYFLPLIRNKYKLVGKMFNKFRNILIKIQRISKIKNKKICEYDIKKGTDWYSITHEAVKFIIDNEPKYKQCFYRTYCPTEYLAQTILWNSYFKENIYLSVESDEYEQCVRAIDWYRGSPYTYIIEDKEVLLTSKAIFARKFDENKDLEIVEFLTDYVKDI